jgi:hypothetical protein
MASMPPDLFKGSLTKSAKLSKQLSTKSVPIVNISEMTIELQRQNRLCSMDIYFSIKPLTLKQKERRGWIKEKHETAQLSRSSST